MISFLSVLSVDVINCSDCTASVIDELVSSTDGMTLTLGRGGGVEKGALGEESVPMAICPTKVRSRLPWDRMWVLPLRSWELTV
jgi:hypothetical protein